jgi:ABC-2 type transport system ATP-binding protein
MTAPAIQAIAVGRRFGAFTALQAISLSVAAGEVVGFLGENGAGKTTTMRILTGALAPSAGRAAIAGHDVVAAAAAARAAVGYLPDQPPLHLDMTVAAALDFAGRLKGIPAASRRAAVLDAMEATDVLHHRDRRIHALSKGNRQRVGLAQALIGRPPVLILDEPTSGLDPTQTARFRDLIRGLAGRHAVLLSTHILAEVEAMCSRAVVVHRGTTVAEASIEELRRRAGIRLLVRLASPAGVARVLAVPGLVPVSRGDDHVLCTLAEDRRADLVAAAGADLRELTEVRPGLAEIFASLTAA